MKTAVNLKPKKSVWQKLKASWMLHKWLYIMSIPFIAYFIIFKYIPMYGAQIAFKDYDVFDGIVGSPWVGLKHFKEFLSDYYFACLVKNTLAISLLSVVWSFPAPILFALLMNELRQERFKKVVQTITYLPHFISVIVICGTTAKLDSTLSNDDYQDTAYCVVDRIIEYATEDGEIIKQLHGFNTSKEVVFNVHSNKYSLLEGLKKGDVVMVKNDFITDYVSDIDFIGNKDSEYKRSTRKVSSSGIPYYESIRGVVTNKFGATLKISTLISDAEVEKIYPASGGTVFIIEDGKIRYGNIGEVQIEDEILLRSRASAVKEVVIFR